MLKVRMYWLPRFGLLLAVLSASARAQIYEGKPLVEATLLADASAIVPGQSFTAGLLLKMQPGWHTYWQYPGDSGMPTRIDWQLPAGFHASQIQWPIPEKIVEEGGLWTYAYHDEVLLLVTIETPARLPEKSIAIGARARWLVCEKICVPGEADLSLNLPVAGANQPANTDVFTKYRARLPHLELGHPAGWNLNPESATLHVPNFSHEGALDFFPLPQPGLVIEHVEGAPAAGGIDFRIPLATPPEKPLTLSGVLVAKNADGSSREGWAVPALTLTPSLTAQSAAPGGLLRFLLFGFLGGLILNVMPCVLPVIALKIFGFIKQAHESPQKIFRLGLAFVAGIFAWFGFLAALVVIFRSLGTQLNWAFQFQHPGFLVAMIVILLVFALNLLGLFEILLPSSTQNRIADLSGREGYGGAFLHGVFATLMATPCTAPFLGPALGFALAQNVPTVFAMFAAIAAGMSSPYLALAVRPGWLRFLPKPGVWMVRVKQALGILLLGTVAWLGWVLYQQAQGRQPFAPTLEAALREGRPVFVDFTADWCVNCKVNEKLVLDTAAVQQAFREKKVIVLKADWTSGDSGISVLLKKFGRAGVPLYVLYRPGAEPVVLPEVITKQLVLDALNQL